MVTKVREFVSKFRKFQQDIFGPLFNDHYIVEKDDQILGVGCLKLTCELFLVVNTDANQRDKAGTLKELIAVAVQHGQNRGLDEVHAFLTGGPDTEKFEQTLIKHFGFERVEGVPLVLRIK